MKNGCGTTFLQEECSVFVVQYNGRLILFQPVDDRVHVHIEICGLLTYNQILKDVTEKNVEYLDSANNTLSFLFKKQNSPTTTTNIFSFNKKRRMINVASLSSSQQIKRHDRNKHQLRNKQRVRKKKEQKKKKKKTKKKKGKRALTIHRRKQQQKHRYWSFKLFRSSTMEGQNSNQGQFWKSYLLYNKLFSPR